MTSTRRAALPVAVTLAVACLMAPAMAVETSADDEEITFGGSEADAPVTAPGRYQFTMPDEDTDNYLAVERTTPRSTIWVGQTLVQHVDAGTATSTTTPPAPTRRSGAGTIPGRSRATTTSATSS